MRIFLAGLSCVAVLTALGCGSVSSTPGNSPGTSGAGLSSTGAAPGATVPRGPGAITPENSKITWVGTKPGGKHDGGFSRFAGTVTPVTGDVTAAKITVDIDTDSLTSDEPTKLTGHLKSPDFFEVKKYPMAKFVSTSIKAEAKDGNTHVITGDLTLHGVTKPITFPAKVVATDDTLAIDSTFTFDRTEYGIAYAPDKVDKIVTVTVSVKTPRK